jgi:outer membrane lipoprotein-sorting protein
MIKILMFLILIAAILAVTNSSAQNDYKPLKDIGSFKDRLAKVSESTKSIECEFVQEKSLSILTNKTISKGVFCYKKENKIRWEYLEPNNYLVVIVNNKVTVKDDKSKKQYDSGSNKMFKESISMMLDFIHGNISGCEKDYTITGWENQQSYYLKMIPKSSKVKKILSQVDLYFDKKDLTMNRLKMSEPGGDYTSIDFVNKILNSNIPDEKFVIR